MACAVTQPWWGYKVHSTLVSAPVVLDNVDLVEQVVPDILASYLSGALPVLLLGPVIVVLVGRSHHLPQGVVVVSRPLLLQADDDHYAAQVGLVMESGMWIVGLVDPVQGHGCQVSCACLSSVCVTSECLQTACAKSP